jgi:sRNA-binding protein
MTIAPNGEKPEMVQDTYSKSELVKMLTGWYKENPTVVVKKIAKDEVRVTMDNGDDIVVQIF